MIKAVTIYNKIGRLRKAISAEGTPSIQEAWDALEPYVSLFLNGGVQGGTIGKNGDDKGGSGHLG